MSNLEPLVWTLGITTVALLSATALLHTLKRLGPPGLALRERLSAGLGLDLVVAYFTVLPLVAAPLVWSLLRPATPEQVAPASLWAHALSALAGQLLALYTWCGWHELANRRHTRTFRLVDAINQNLARRRLMGGSASGARVTTPPGFLAMQAGRLRNHFALLWMLLAVPVFNIVRLAEYVVYPVLVVTTGLPRYDARQWVNVSRHKLDGLVGHDLVWCLYCDWMTGVWSLGTEMLRNIESFWCPIRFHNADKCRTCAQDFPDVDGAWSSEHASAQDAARLHAAKYPAPDGDNSWLGHPARRVTLTIGASGTHAGARPATSDER
jgi:hypothetical protein